MYKRLLTTWLIFVGLAMASSVAVARVLDSAAKFAVFGSEQGLSQETVKSIVQDDRGFIWLATLDGLNRFDGVEFKVYRNSDNDVTSLSNNQVNVLYRDKAARLWVGTADGLNRYEPQYDRFSRVHYQQNDHSNFEHQHITAIAEDANGLLWLATLGGLMMFDPQDGCVELFSHDANDPSAIGTNRLRSVFVDSHNRIWVGTDGAGLDLFDRKTGSFIHFAKAPSSEANSQADNPEALLLSHNRVTAINEDNSGNLWVGTMAGLNRISRDLSQSDQFHMAKSKEHGLISDVVVSLAIDEDNRVYVGTIGGLSVYDPITAQFSSIPTLTRLSTIVNSSIWGIYFDAQGALWLGSNQGIAKLSPFTQDIQWLRHSQGDRTSLSHSNVTSLLFDGQKRLWLGTHGGGLNRTKSLSGEYWHYRLQAGVKGSIASDIITALALDNKQRVWVGTSNGLQRYDEQTDGFVSVKLNDPSKGAGHVTALAKGGNNRLYVGVKDLGLIVLSSKDGQVLQRYDGVVNPVTGFKSKHINSLLYQNGQIWIATLDAGIVLLDEHSGQLKSPPLNQAINGLDAVLSLAHGPKGSVLAGSKNHGLIEFTSSDERRVFTTANGLSNNRVNAITYDSSGFIWLSHNDALSRVELVEDKVATSITLGSFDNTQFNPNAVLSDQGNMLYFGGDSGVSVLNPVTITQASASMNIVFTELLLYNRPVKTRTQEQSDEGFSLEQSLDFLTSLTLTEKENFFTIKFAATKVLDPASISFAYRLKGWDKGWIQAGNHERRVTYTNIPPGDYTLEVKATSQGYFWTHHIKRLPITILPPLWQSWWAYGLYTLIGIALVLMIIYVRIEHLRAEKESILNQQLKQVDKLKDEFLANISHELKTPLNGIIGLAESLLDGASGPLPNKALSELTMIVSSSKRLSNLVNDILDFSKLNNDGIELNKKAIDVMALSDVVVALCQPLIGSKELKIFNRIAEDLPAVYADEERIGQVLHNLIVNAIKFTDKGHISLLAKQLGNHIIITVEDTGIGIEASQLDAIFLSFNQGHKGMARPYGGSGLGLAVSRQLIELHHGTLTVSSKPGVGTTFAISLPIAVNAPALNLAERPNPQRKPPAAQALQPETIQSDELPLTAKAAHNSRFKILLVDDEPINRQVLLNHLSAENYQLVEASGGQQAIEIINRDQEREPFDLILLDLMMPRVSGIEVCQQVRKKHSINDLPIIFLTARSQASDLVQSFEVGANDYLSKPVAKHELLSRVKTHLKLLDINKNLEAKVEQRTQALKKSNQQNNAINEICTQISTTLDLEKLKDTAYNHLKELMDVYTFCIGIYHPDKQHIAFNFVIEGGAYLEPFKVEMTERNRPAVWCVKNRQPLVINDYLRDHGKYFGDDEVPMKPMKGIKVQSLVYWPLIVSDQVIGVLSVQSHEKNAYNQQHLDMISTLASTAAIAVDNANAYSEIEQKNKALISTQEQLIQQEKMASLGTLTAGVAHEINNPTNFVHVSAQNLEVDLTRVEQFFIELAGEDADKAILETFAEQFKPLREHLETIQDGTERIKNIVKDLRLFTQLDSEQKQRLDVTQCIESTLHLVKTKYLEVADFHTQYEGDTEIDGYPSQLNQVFMNLLVNACDAIKERNNPSTTGMINISCKRLADHVEVCVSDNGSGMSELTKTKLFEPFYTTKAVGHGTGLGLSISYGIVQKHGGELSVHSEIDVGTEFTLKLPV